MNECSRTHYRTFTNTIERMRPLFMFVHLTNRTKFLVRVRSFIKQTNVNELPVKRFTNCSLNVRFIYSPSHNYKSVMDLYDTLGWHDLFNIFLSFFQMVNI
ncbi:hypothetical protein Hanom_Chr16g01509241 [Helianthus anomalus]